MTQIVLRNAPEFASGSGVITVADVDVGMIRQQVGQLPGGLTFRAVRTEPWVKDAVPGTVASITTRSETYEYMIGERRDRLTSDWAVFRADPIHVVMHDAGIVDWIDPDGASHINLGGADSGMSFRNFWNTFLGPFLSRHDLDWIELGDVESDDRLIHSWEGVSAQKVIVELAYQLSHEWRLRRDAANNRYLLDVGEDLGSDELESRAGQGLNLITIRRQLDRERMATVIRPIGRLANGAPGDISLALWRVSAVSGNNVTLAAHADVGGAGPVGETDQWVGSYLEAPNGNSYEIAGSATSQVITLASGGSNFSEDNEVRFVADTGGTPLFEVVSPNGLDKFGRIAIGTRLAFLGSSLAEVASLVDFEAQTSIVSTGSVVLSSSGLIRFSMGDSITVDDVGVGDICVFQGASGSHEYVSGRVTAVTFTGSFTEVTLEGSEQTLGLSAVISPGLPTGWLWTGGSEFLPVFSRDASVSGSIGDVGVANNEGIQISVTGLPANQRLEPGDLLSVGQAGKWVIAGVNADGAGDADVVVVDGRDGVAPPASGVSVYRPTLDTRLSHVPVMLAHENNDDAEVVLPSVTLTPSDGVGIYARIRFVAMASQALSSGLLTLPRLRLFRDTTEVESQETTQWTPTAVGDQVSREILIGPVTLDTAGSYHLRIRPGFGQTSTSSEAPHHAFYLTEALLTIGTTEPSEGGSLVPEAAQGIQLANRELMNRAKWRARFTCNMVELANVLEMSPEAIRSRIGAKIHVSSPTLGLDGKFRIVGIRWSPEDVDTEVELESLPDRLTSRRQLDPDSFVRDTGQRVSTIPPSTPGYYRANEVSSDDLDSDDVINVELIE